MMAIIRPDSELFGKCQHSESPLTENGRRESFLMRPVQTIHFYTTYVMPPKSKVLSSWGSMFESNFTFNISFQRSSADCFLREYPRPVAFRSETDGPVVDPEHARRATGSIFYGYSFAWARAHRKAW